MTRVLLATTALAICLAACGGAAPTPKPAAATTTAGAGSGAANQYDACVLFSQADASRISGGSVAKVTGTGAGPASECIWSDQSSGVSAVAVIESFPTTVAGAEMQAAIAQASHGSGSTQPVSGLGDQAFKEVQPDSAVVAFAKGSVLVVVEVAGSARSGTAIESDLESLCRQILGKL